MIHTVGEVGNDGTTIFWFFIISYTGTSIMMPKMRKHLNRKGAITFFYKMIQREKKYGRTATS